MFVNGTGVDAVECENKGLNRRVIAVTIRSLVNKEGLSSQCEGVS